MLDALPLPAGSIRRFGGWIAFGMVLAVAIAVGAVMRVPQMVGTAVGESIGEAGFAVKRVEIKGLDRMQRLPVYAVVLDQDSMAMPLVDLDETRDRLLRFGWIKEARVSRRLPDTLVVDIVERQPTAIWQHEQKLTLIDNEGVMLEQVKLEAMPDLPLVIGRAANRQAGRLALLIDAAPALKPMLAGATWVGGRRWDLRFQSGEVLALPEGQIAAQKALVHFARMDQAAQLLGRGLVRFDMRVPGKFIVRVSREPGSVVPLIDPATNPGSPDPATTI
ncbi:MAG: FtsQ-type POTRA domain-containing protein [Sphingosinicella sp.]|nr:FtsQ-type POTRA domain-containing protein [Sphingosinicella sp.]